MPGNQREVDLAGGFSSGGATDERSSWPPLATCSRRPAFKLKLLGVAELADQGAGHPGFLL